MANKSTKRKLLNWVPNCGRYENVLPAGTLHVDVYIDGRTPDTLSLRPGEEVDLHEPEIRALKKSGLLQKGYLAPTVWFIKGKDGQDTEVEATEDASNPNLVSTAYLNEKLSDMKDGKKFASYLSGITSVVTLNRIMKICNELDTPQSFIAAIQARLSELEEEDKAQVFSTTDIPEERKRLLTPKIKV